MHQVILEILVQEVEEWLWIKWKRKTNKSKYYQDCNEEGSVVEIHVNQNGKVINAVLE